MIFYHSIFLDVCCWIKIYPVCVELICAAHVSWIGNFMFIYGFSVLLVRHLFININPKKQDLSNQHASLLHIYLHSSCHISFEALFCAFVCSDFLYIPYSLNPTSYGLHFQHAVCCKYSCK